MILLSVVLLLVVGILYRLTAGSRLERVSQEMKPGEIPVQVLDLSRQTFPAVDSWLADPARAPGTGAILLELMDRLGADPRSALRELRKRGYSGGSPDLEFGNDFESARSPGVRVVSAREDLGSVVERALLVGIQVARIDDDYAGVSDDRRRGAPGSPPGGIPMDMIELERRAEKAEMQLFGEGRRQRAALYTKAVIVLQDMRQASGKDRDRSHFIQGLLEGFDRHLERTQEEIDKAMALLPDSGELLWGDGGDRRLYYFKLGVTNALRRSGYLNSLSSLYRLQGVNFDVEEAYDLASEEANPLVLADAIGIERLVAMGPAEVHNLVHRSLSDRTG